ncbi:MAG TPA: PA14 domain-containing protein, partial [Thermoanaerobaculia bacterium]|nr:PA14 domain-containing protein [Thermoanaerobaculia bacterium]
YTYLSSRLALLTLGAFGLWWLLAAPEGPRAAWRRHRRGLLFYLLAALLALAPLAVTYVTDPFTFTNRMREISIFNEVREKESLEPLYENVRRHLRFFHQEGDPSGKHNLPGEPQTDPVTGVLFVVGLGYGLFRLGDRRRVLLWLWLVVAMLAGVFSVLHESPQAYRTLNAVPAIAILAGDVLARLARAAAAVAGSRSVAGGPRFLRAAIAAAIVIAGLAGAGLWETSVYFGRQARSPAVRGSFNLMEIGVTREVLAALERGSDVYLSPRFYTFSPLRYLVYGVVKERTGESTLDRPPYRLAQPEVDLPFPARGGDVLLLLDAYYWPVRDHFLATYPSARLDLVADEEDRPMYLRVEIARAEVAALQGLEARFTSARGEVESKVVDAIAETWSGRDVAVAEWRGGLRVEVTGAYEPVAEGGLELWVDDQRWDGPRVLGRGLHRLRVAQAECGARGSARLRWRRASGDGAGEIAGMEGALFRVEPPESGLLGEFFPNDRWEGPPLYTQITPFVLLAWEDPAPLPSAFTATFTGAIEIATAGRYRFRIVVDDGARLTLGGVVVAEELTPHRLNHLQADVDLDAGLHPLRIDYLQSGGGSALELFWEPPGGAEAPVPPSVLRRSK